MTEPPFDRVHKKMWLRPLDNTGALNLMVHATNDPIPRWQAYLCQTQAVEPNIIWAELLPTEAMLVAEDAKRAANAVIEVRLAALSLGAEVVPDIVYVHREDGMVETRYSDGTVWVSPAWKPD